MNQDVRNVMNQRQGLNKLAILIDESPGDPANRVVFDEKARVSQRRKLRHVIGVAPDCPKPAPAPDGWVFAHIDVIAEDVRRGDRRAVGSDRQADQQKTPEYPSAPRAQLRLKLGRQFRLLAKRDLNVAALHSMRAVFTVPDAPAGTNDRGYDPL